MRLQSFETDVPENQHFTYRATELQNGKPTRGAAPRLFESRCSVSHHVPFLSAPCMALLCGGFPLRSIPVFRRCLLQAFSKDLTSFAGAIPKRFKAGWLPAQRRPPHPGPWARYSTGIASRSSLVGGSAPSESQSACRPVDHATRSTPARTSPVASQSEEPRPFLETKCAVGHRMPCMFSCLGVERLSCAGR